MRALIITLLVIIFTFGISVDLKANILPEDCIVINIPSRTLDLYRKGTLKKTYPVGVGRAQFPTPVGKFKVITMVKQPGWENPYKPFGYSRINAGSANPLGTRWIGFKEDSGGEYGIHGTDNPQSVGKFSSHGCVRMLVKDAEDLFINIKMHMPVIVTYDTVRVFKKDSEVFLKTFPDTYKKGISDINTVKQNIKAISNHVLWNASVALESLKAPTNQPVKIGTIIDETDFY
ncbi:MAG: L,D-transpeptidase [Cyanobacteriota bacterium]